MFILPWHKVVVFTNLLGISQMSILREKFMVVLNVLNLEPSNDRLLVYFHIRISPLSSRRYDDYLLRCPRR